MKARSDQAGCLPERLQAGSLSRSRALIGWLNDGGFGVLPAEVTDATAVECELSIPQLMVAMIPAAGCFADPAISNFAVGSVARGATGTLYFGANAEFPPLPLNLTIHAEQAAVLNAWHHGESAITHLAISAVPCGLCRQFLYELPESSGLEVALPHRQLTKLGQLLPEAFGPRELGIDASMMRVSTDRLELEGVDVDPVIAATLVEAERSYAPYSGALAAVSLVTRTGASFIGRYAENAAFNPSIHPAVAALSSLRLGGGSPSSIVRAVLVEHLTSLDHEPVGRLLIEHATDAKLEVFRARVSTAASPRPT